MINSASRKLCNTDDNKEALESRKWLYHESCWNDAARAMREDRPVEVKYNGGIRMYGVPFHTGGEIVGAINFGYGSPPTDEAELETLSQKYNISVDELRKQAEASNPRPQFIIDYAKKRKSPGKKHQIESIGLILFAVLWADKLPLEADDPVVPRLHVHRGNRAVIIGSARQDQAVSGSDCLWESLG